MQVTGHKVLTLDLDQIRLLMRAVLHHFRAARCKATAGRRVNEIRRPGPKFLNAAPDRPPAATPESASVYTGAADCQRWRQSDHIPRSWPAYMIASRSLI